MGAVISGIIGALALNLINRLIADKQKKQLNTDKVEKRNEILNTQNEIIQVNKVKTEEIKYNVSTNIKKRHERAAQVMKESLDNISNNRNENKNDFGKMNSDLDALLEGGNLDEN